jgi:hypothetical protein
MADKNFFKNNPEAKFYCPVEGDLLSAAEWLQIQEDVGELFPDEDFETLIPEEDA